MADKAITYHEPASTDVVTIQAQYLNGQVQSLTAVAALRTTPPASSPEDIPGAQVTTERALMSAQDIADAEALLSSCAAAIATKHGF